ncbi:MAG: GAF domain-containing protein, partial [Myxococcota bacterium]
MDFKGIDRWLTPDESVDLNNCDREPIHIPSLIQPHGAMLVLNDNDDVVQASANVDEMLGGIDVSGFLGAWRASSSLPEIQSGRAAVEMSLGGTTTCTISHRIDGVRVLEIEAIQRKTDIHLLNMVNRASKTLELAKTQDEAYQLLVEQIQLLTGYDRVLAYIFDSDGHGTVRASKTVAEMDDFLGLRFPATDIPKQARRLYALELTRQIVDVHYVPVPLVPNLNPLTQRPLNMAFCQLRSVSPIHVEYLKNMGVQASFSVSVVVDNELMALIACHHRTPRHMDFRVRQACELLGRLSSEKFARRAEEQRRAQRNRQFAAQVDLLCELGEAVKVDVNNRAWTLVQGFVESDALLVEFQGQQRVYGDAPNKLEVMWRLGSRLAHKKPSKNRSTIQMTALDIHAPPGGLLVVPIAESGWLGWYRCSEDEHIQWAGKPQAPKDKDLTPRHSFEVWRETISGQCRR